MRLIPLRGKYGQGKFAIVDHEDFHRLISRKWFVTNGYPASGNKFKESNLYLHHAVNGKPVTGYVTDHINGNPFDARRTNLRTVTYQENARNAPAQGYSWDETHHKWRVRIRVGGGRKTHVGYYDTTEDARRAYEAAVVELHGEYVAIGRRNA